MIQGVHPGSSFQIWILIFYSSRIPDPQFRNTGPYRYPVRNIEQSISYCTIRPQMQNHVRAEQETLVPNPTIPNEYNMRDSKFLVKW
jgi:hypothetical protein